MKIARVCILAFVVIWVLLAGGAVAEYRVGEGDVLAITVFQEKELDRVVRVSADGYIAFPLVGKVKVSGLTALEIADLLTEKLAADYLVNPQVDVFVREYVSRYVEVMGKVGAPGRYNLMGDAHLTNILSRAGGPTKEAGRTLVLVRAREDGDGFEGPVYIDLYGLLEEGDMSLNVTVHSGDLVFVPGADEVYVNGEVSQPGPVVYVEGMTLMQAISKVGSFKSTAAVNRIQIVRRVDGKEQILRVDGRKIQDGKEPDPVLIPGDLITVPRSRI